jgi:hypothetical protein
LLLQLGISTIGRIRIPTQRQKNDASHDSNRGSANEEPPVRDQRFRRKI